MLSKLGWAEGQTLGKNEDGIREPVSRIIYTSISLYP